MAARTSIGIATLSVSMLLTGALAPQAGAAPGAAAARQQAPVADTGDKTVWTEADKSGFGTARTRRSNVWFTLQRGRASEVFYPDLSTPSVRNLELVVTDGATFTDRESGDMRHRTVRPDERSLRSTQVNTARSGKYRLVKEIVTDPRRDTMTLRVRLRSLDGEPYQVYALFDPALGNDGSDDSARSRGRALVATDDALGAALVARRGFGATSNALLGRGDGWSDLADDHRLDRRARRAGPGNVVQVGRLRGLTGRPGHQFARLALGFGTTGPRARRAARATLRSGFTATAARYDAGWHRYVGSLHRVPASAAEHEREYLASALVLAAAEDKQNPGAIVASPSAPWVWGDNIPDLSSPSGAYHLVWSRDAYQFGTALWAQGDHAAARRVVDWLFRVQQRPDGSFPQNSDVRGNPVWSELQLDEVALPIVLAHLVGRTDRNTYRHVRKAADFIADFVDPETGRAAPYSPQERWENQAGYSPNSIAAQVAGLVTAAHMARKHGDGASARRWLALADRWQAKVEDWTVTTNGPLSTEPYFLRLTKNGRPDTGVTYAIGDGGPSDADQRTVVDPSFLDLVRLGIEPPDDPAVLSTLPVVDRELKVDTPHGPYWHRFSFDGYGETRAGGEWRITDDDTFQTLGRGWPLLSGERGEYAVASGQDADQYLEALAGAAGQGDLIAEQVWDGRPPTGRACCRLGEGTRAATPLVWSHAGLVRLAWTIERGRPVDQPRVVADRYLHR